MDDDTILVDWAAPRILRFTLNDPKTRNASSTERTQRLLGLFQNAMADPGVRVIILTGADGHFASGGNIRNFADRQPLEVLASVRCAQATLRCVFGGDKPVIAAVEGYAAGAGVGLAAMCDIVVSGQEARFVLPFSRIGMVPDMGLHFTLGFRIGNGRARAALLEGVTFTADEAYRLGLTDKLVETGTVQASAVELATKLAGNAPGSMASLKRGFLVAANELDSVLEYEACAMAVAMSGSESKEGVQAFLEKRNPVF